MQFNLLNILVVALPLVGSASAWTNLVAICDKRPPSGNGNCAPADAAQCTSNPIIAGTCPGATFRSAWAAPNGRCDCWFTR